MYKLPKFLFRCSLVALAPIAANAAGTYYTGAYQSPQQRYSNQSYSSVQRGSTYTQNGVSYNRVGQNGYNNAPYAGNRAQQGARPQNNQGQSAPSSATTKVGNGFTVGGGLSRESAVWRFEMKDVGSILRYDDISWNVLDLHGAYDFNVGSMNMRVNAGFKYGMQSGDGSMTDDDVTKGGRLVQSWYDTLTGEITGNQIEHALSIGTSKDGNMYGFNVGVGLVDVFKIGNLKMTPSIGYRYLKYKLETKKNYGVAVNTAQCFDFGDGEIECDPILVFYDQDNNMIGVEFRDDVTKHPNVLPGATTVDPEGTFYFEQSGVSHSYDVTWSGPYIAMDMVYDINNKNSVNGYVELGFPGYTSTGDQPYRFDWQHPKSVEDKAGMFSALHLGLGANWMTALTDSISLSLGVTYDYYTVSGADASTYLNSEYYMKVYNTLLSQYASEAEMLENNQTAQNIDALRKECPGWVCKDGDEVESFYKSLGVRLGIVARF